MKWVLSDVDATTRVAPDAELDIFILSEPYGRSNELVKREISDTQGTLATLRAQHTAHATLRALQSHSWYTITNITAAPADEYCSSGASSLQIFLHPSSQCKKIALPPIIPKLHISSVSKLRDVHTPAEKNHFYSAALRITSVTPERTSNKGQPLRFAVGCDKDGDGIQILLNQDWATSLGATWESDLNAQKDIYVYCVNFSILDSPYKERCLASAFQSYVLEMPESKALNQLKKGTAAMRHPITAATAEEQFTCELTVTATGHGHPISTACSNPNCPNPVNPSLTKLDPKTYYCDICRQKGPGAQVPHVQVRLHIDPDRNKLGRTVFVNDQQLISKLFGIDNIAERYKASAKALSDELQTKRTFGTFTVRDDTITAIQDTTEPPATGIQKMQI